MRFDDRLKTVLAQRPSHPHDRAVRWRQLVELLARAGGDTDSPLVAEALAAVRSEAGEIDDQLRSATARAIARPGLPASVVGLFAADSVAVAAPVLAAAQLSPEDWAAVMAEASGGSRRFLRSLHPELDEAPVEAPVEAPPPPPPAEDEEASEPQDSPPPVESVAGVEEPPVPSISEVVARIERLRSEREKLARASGQPGAGTAESRDSPGLFRWECGPTGEIAWVEGAPRGVLIGRSLANPGEHNGVDERIQRAFALRAPFRDAKLSISGEGIAAGDWKISGVPAFEPADGRFAGYRGVATRGDQRPGTGVEGSGAGIDHAAIRELMHELKTPLNAIIGFAEIIDGQYLGPADFAYRERAADIVAQARQLLSAIEDLDIAAKLRSAPEQAGGSADLRAILAHALQELMEHAGRRGAALHADLPSRPLRCAVEQGLAGRIVRRFCTSILDSAAGGEQLRLTLTDDRRQCVLSLDKPRALAAAGGLGQSADLPDAMIATVVSLRLARALARVAGGDLVDGEDRASLILPSLD